MLLLPVLTVSSDLPLGISRYSGAGYRQCPEGSRVPGLANGWPCGSRVGAVGAAGGWGAAQVAGPRGRGSTEEAG